MNRTFPILAVLLLAAGFTGPARGAQSYDSCTGFIDALPATISTRGTWCLRKDLYTSLSSGYMITVEADDVTIDCNHHKLGNQSAGTATSATGIGAINRRNTTVRQCDIRGFTYGAMVSGVTTGNLIEDNRFDSNTYGGMYVRGHGSVVRRNLIVSTGGSTWEQAVGRAVAITVDGGVDVQDNIIDGVSPLPKADLSANAIGILVYQGHGASVTGNRIRGIASRASGIGIGIQVDSTGGIQVIAGNEIVGDGRFTTKAIYCGKWAYRIMVSKNIVLNHYQPLMYCDDRGGNVVLGP